MKKGITTHPTLFDVSIKCTCGATFDTRSAVKKNKVTICSQCHPFYTGDEKFVDTAGRIEKFKSKFKNFKSNN